MLERIARSFFTSILVGLSIAGGPGAFAQTAPDTGRVLQELEKPPVEPKQDREFPLVTPQGPAGVQPGGAVVEIRSVHLTGNSVFASAVLLRQLGAVSGRKLDLAGLRALADAITSYYRRHGYPFTRAIIPQQDVSQGDLRIQVVEGQYGRVVAGAKDPRLEHGAARFLQPLHRGDPIEARSLERVLLLLDNQPGMRVSPTVAPGEQAGEGDLTANITRVAHFGADVGVDNEGDRYTGMYREKLNAYAYSPFLFGDMVTLRGTHTNENMWMGTLDYETPLSGSGLRGHAGYTRTSYRLGGEFEVLGASGFANIAAFGISYPIVRSRVRNLTVGLDYQYESLRDRYAAIGTVDEKYCNCFPLTLQFDNRDSFLGGGVTYGALVLTGGSLRLGAGLGPVDSRTARTAGTFGKLNLDVSRIQALTKQVNWMVRYAAQFTNKNLDSSEQLNLGGVYGVRAYPVGEGIGARGWLLQTELRFPINDFIPYVLYDAARSRTNVRPWDNASDVQRHLAGAGFGCRYVRGHWAVDALMSWRTTGGRPVSDTYDAVPRIWASASYRF